MRRFGLVLFVLFLFTLALVPLVARAAIAPVIENKTDGVVTGPDEPCATIEEVGRIEGEWYTVAVSGTVAYVGGPNSLALFDVSNPVSPTLQGHFAVPYVTQVQIEHNHAYVAVSQPNKKLAILDVSDPTQPTLRGTHSLPASANVREFDVSNGIAYIATRDPEILYIVNLTQPDQPHLLGSHTLGGLAFDIEVVADTAYLVVFNGEDTPYSGLQVVDVSNSAQPRFLQHFFEGTVFSMDGVGNRLYAGGKAFAGFDISNPRNPILYDGNIGGSYRTYYDLQFSSPFVYAAFASGRSDYGGLDVYHFLDLENPCAYYRPSPEDDRAREVEVVDDLVFLLYEDGGIEILRVTPNITFEHFLPSVYR